MYNESLMMEKVVSGDIHSFEKYISNESHKINMINFLRINYEGSSILNKFIRKLMYSDSTFCFMVIYDMEEYKDFVKEFLNKTEDSLMLWNEKMIKNALNKTSWMKDYILNNFDKFEKYAYPIIMYICSNIDKNKDLIEKLLNSDNPNTKLFFFSEVASQCDYYIEELMPNIINLLDGSVELDEYELSRFAERILRNNKYPELFKKLKEYILKNYEKNQLGGFLVGGNQREKEELLKNIDTYFETSSNARLDIFVQCQHSVETKIFDDLKRHLEMLNGKNNNSFNWRIQNIFYNGLDHIMEEFMDKYLAKSKSNETGFIGSGTTTSCYRLGDYVLKIMDESNSPTVICPNLYLILPNLEEVHLKNQENIYIAGLAIQKYLSKDANNLPLSALHRFRKMFEDEGYRAMDINFDNCRLLDSYQDADCKNPEDLPEEFKKLPLVLIDRELVFPIEEGKKLSKRFI